MVPQVARVILVGTKQRPTTNPSGAFIRPIKGGNETSKFSAGHRALDICAPVGTVIVASDGGTIIYAGFSGSYGNHVKIRHGNNYVTLYAHMSSMSVKQGDQVFKGQEIGRVGSTGYSTGPHVHFEIIKNGVQVNPKDYIN
jgi:murein DD-endopeptidase MepM/ murein hydrolase activator NlpD